MEGVKKEQECSEGEEQNERCISAYFCCSSCDVGQCGATEPVMSLMQHTTKVTLH